LVHLLRSQPGPVRYYEVSAAQKEEITSFSSIPEIMLEWKIFGLHGGVYYGLVCDKPAVN
jgi:hypothetical protein